MTTSPYNNQRQKLESGLATALDQTPPTARPSVAVLVVAAGNSRRFGGDVPKQYLRLRGRTILNRAMDQPFAALVLAVIGAEHQALYMDRVFHRDNHLPPVIGGANRQQSVLNGLEALAKLPAPPEVVLIHDAARPEMPERVFLDVADAARRNGGAFAALTSTDSLHQTDDENRVATVLPRHTIQRAQTPQGFRFDAILAAHRAAAGLTLTDDVAVAREAGISVVAVPGAPEGEKITFSQDLPSGSSPKPAAQGPILAVRTGVGYDVHAFEQDSDQPSPLILGGITIPHPVGLSGHSDADVLLHTITDALLGALGNGDIGEHFPPSDPQWKGAASDQFLIHAANLARADGWTIEHVDSTTICEAPKLSAHKAEMRASIASILQIDRRAVSVKATTSERLGFTGRREGIAAAATVTLVQRG